MSHLLIYSNISIPPPVSLLTAAPSSLNPELVRPRSLRIIGQDDENDDIYLKGEFEGDTLESDPELYLNLVPDSPK